MPGENRKLNVARDRVTAVVVSIANDAAFLPRTIAALARQTRLPDRVIIATPTAATAASAAHEPRIHSALADRLMVVPVGAAESCAHAVAVALKRMSDVDTPSPIASRPSNLSFSDSSSPHSSRLNFHSETLKDRQWLWILHADSSPEPEALEALIEKAESSTKIAVVGPKQVAPRTDENEPPILREAGIRATRYARRVPEMRAEERDQGQFDAREDVLAVGTAGMLVRGDVWEKLGGLNKNFAQFGDGLEFCRRVWLAGYRVVLAPKAVVTHERLSLGSGDDLARSFGARRKAQILNALIAAPSVLVVPLWLWYILGGIVRGLIRLVWRDQARARGELAAGFSTLGIVRHVASGRAALAQLNGNHDALRQLEASAREVREGKRAVRRAEADEYDSRSDIDPLLVRARQDLRVHTRRGMLLTLLISCVFTILLAVPTIAGGTLAGGALATDSSTASDIWNAARHSWLISGDGSVGTIDPLWICALPFLALGATWGLTLGQFATAVLYAAPSLAALCAYLAAGRFTKSSVARTLVALIWVMSPSLLEALRQGRVAAAIVHCLLPLAVFSIVGAWRRARTPALEARAAKRARKRAHAHGNKAKASSNTASTTSKNVAADESAIPPAGTPVGEKYQPQLISLTESSSTIAGTQIGVAALVFAVLAAATPMFVLAAIGVSFIGFIGRPYARKRWLWVPVPAILLLLPTALHVGTSWRAWLAYAISQPGQPFGEVTPARQVLLGFNSRLFHPLHPNLDWLLFAPVIIFFLAALVALIRLRVARTVRIAWLLISVGIAIAVGCSYVPVAVASQSGLSLPVPGWYGVGFSIAWLGVFIALASAANGLRASLRRKNFGPLTVLAVLFGAVIPFSLATEAAYWVYLYWNEPHHVLSAEPSSRVPAVGASSQESPSRSRVLAINATERGYSIQIWRDNGLQMHEYTMASQARKAAALYPISGIGVTPERDIAAKTDLAESDVIAAVANIPAAGEHVAATFADHAISVVLLPPADANSDIQARSALRAYLNAVPGLDYVTDNSMGVFWRVQQNTGDGDASELLRSTSSPETDADHEKADSEAMPFGNTPARVRLVDSSGNSQMINSKDYEVRAEIKSASTERYLVMAERASRSWIATVDGQQLDALTADEARAAGLPAWAQSWRVPADHSGQVHVYRTEYAHRALLTLAALALVISIVTALPLRSRKEDVA